MIIRQAHSNRRAHNWLIYDIGDEWLNRFTDHYKGHLYDLGCGEMPYKDWLLNYADTYTGVDWGSSLHNLKADILPDLNEPLPIENEVADTVISLSVMEHLREAQVFLDEAHGILKPGGAKILRVPSMWSLHEAPYDYYRYTRFGLKYMYKKAEYLDIRVYPQTGLWSSWTSKLNYQSTAGRGRSAKQWLFFYAASGLSTNASHRGWTNTGRVKRRPQGIWCWRRNPRALREMPCDD